MYCQNPPSSSSLTSRCSANLIDFCIAATASVSPRSSALLPMEVYTADSVFLPTLDSEPITPSGPLENPIKSSKRFPPVTFIFLRKYLFQGMSRTWDKFLAGLEAESCASARYVPSAAHWSAFKTKLSGFPNKFLTIGASIGISYQ